ncbi:MAG: F0F1 ATP synthase subunit A [Marinifilaceae bacterium]|jgi:F-type H+-transporting ATPase subunit a|nr:F0F1 ATP synthase subunit A [Marinifilaceae bacterium]
MKRITTIFLVFAFIFSSSIIMAEEHDTNHAQDHHSKQENKKSFDPGSFIMDHVADSYDWHIASIGEKHISVPLPVILYSNHSGFHCFMSSKFHHGHSSYLNFKIAQDGDYKGKIVETVNGEYIRPIDISMTKNVMAMLVSMILLVWIFVSVGNRYKKNKNKAPKGLQAFVEPIILFVKDEIAIPAIGKKQYKRFMPYLLTVFFFIWINNMMGLIPIIPGGANVTGNISITLVLAMFTFLITTFSSNKNYWVHIFNTPGVPWWLKFPIPLMPLVEFTGILTKPFVLMVRLFANITAGHMIVLAFISLIFIFGQLSPALGYGTSVVSVLFVVFMDMLELLVALIQAYVFTLLSALYFGMATEEHH